ncbi:MAG TPA: exonuclease domain-containing protein [Pyrinomonadaceae bacterium]|jgi:DNA polymerase III epsilon subunit family exonuclease|nr:exonuclease domain-containing protein [Pyrinomonadaceae bacterium]
MIGIMPPLRRNLVSDSDLVQETVDMLRVCGGCAPAMDIADIVLKLSDLDAEMAALVVADLVKDDHRLSLREDLVVELVCEDPEARPLHETDFVVVDVETTGAKTPPSRIMEVGAYRVREGRIVAEFHSLVNPQIPIPPFIVRLTGISDMMVREAPLFADIAHAWLDFVDEAVLVAHNAQFDVRFLNHEIARVYPGRRMINTHLCTVKLSRRIFPGLLNYRLHTVAEHFTIPILNRHRASDDALATAEIFIRMLARLHEHGARDLADARRFLFNAEALSESAC